MGGRANSRRRVHFAVVKRIDPNAAYSDTRVQLIHSGGTKEMNASSFIVSEIID